MHEIAQKPPQIATELSRPFWEGAVQGRLMIQRCVSCGKLRHYPRPLCDECYADAVEWVEASRTGRIHSWTVAHHAFHPAFKAELPYTLVTVDLDEGPRALGRWQGATPLIGQPVHGCFVAREGGVDLVFAPVKR